MKSKRRSLEKCEKLFVRNQKKISLSFTHWSFGEPCFFTPVFVYSLLCTRLISQYYTSAKKEERHGILTTQYPENLTKCVSSFCRVLNSIVEFIVLLRPGMSPMKGILRKLGRHLQTRDSKLYSMLLFINTFSSL